MAPHQHGSALGFSRAGATRSREKLPVDYKCSLGPNSHKKFWWHLCNLLGSNYGAPKSSDKNNSWKKSCSPAPSEPRPARIRSGRHVTKNSRQGVTGQPDSNSHDSWRVVFVLFSYCFQPYKRHFSKMQLQDALVFTRLEVVKRKLDCPRLPVEKGLKKYLHSTPIAPKFSLSIDRRFSFFGNVNFVQNISN